ncbi:MAG: Xaa-Pro peptidase family protein [Acetobacteraceae bacterium]|nr:Xaa-Pro peptidase family protein [Acetobacteraceae bacterium]
MDRARAAGLMAAAGADALLLASPESFAYATGAPAGVAANWRRLGPAIAVLPADPAKPVGAVAADLFAAAASGCEPLRSVPIWVEASDIRRFLPSEEPAGALIARADAARGAGFRRPATFDRSEVLLGLREVVEAMGLSRARIAVELRAVPAADAPALAAALPEAVLTDGSALLERLRAVKTAGEIALLREAGAITEAALSALVAEIRAGATREGLGRRFLALVAEARASAPLSAWEYLGFGPSPWAVRDPLRPGDVVKADVGAVVGGYTADLARSFTLGPAPRLARELHAALLCGFRAGRRLFRPGARLSDIHRSVLAAVREAGFPSYARGHFGHGLGASIWSEEWPYIAADSEAVLEPGMVLAFETPWYVDGIGGLIIEDMLLVTEDGAETLAGAALPHDLVELPA